jgi:hypothetical protein
MVKVVQICLIAETQADALAAVEMFLDQVGSARIAPSSPREGRKGQWLAYGTLQIAAENARYAAERAAVTGATSIRGG